MQYDFIAIESKWQAHWEAHKTFAVANPGEAGRPGDPVADAAKPKLYVLDMFPYPSGVGLHVGHPLGFIATDIVSRYKRMKGFAVLHPMGYDAFGLPAEQFAIEHGVHPRITTEQNIANMTRQLKRLGMSYDWDRTLATADPAYYRWTQWIFLQMYHSWFDPARRKARPISELVHMLESEQLFISPDGELVDNAAAQGLDAIGGSPIGAIKWHELEPADRAQIIDQHRLAYMDEVAVNWCPALGTVLANEEVTNDGRSERGNHPVYQRPLRQWMLRITAYAHRLVDELDLVDWPEPIRLMQRNWIGQSHGAAVDFPLAYGTAQSQEDLVTVFTTRPDTLFGATYMVFAPEHPLVESITTDAQRQAVDDYRRQAGTKTEIDRQAETREKTGVFTGAHAINPVNNDVIPIWIADYVLMGYGTGAIMAVPAHDERDFEFAKTFGLPIKPVVMPPGDWLSAQADDMPDLAGQVLEVIHERYLRDAGQFPAAYTGHGTNFNSANGDISIDQLPTDQAKQTITDWLQSKALGQAQVHYKLRDWLFSRQRYWGEPFPILHGPDGEIVPVGEDELPVQLPQMEDFSPHASDDPEAEVRTPLSRAPDSWKVVERDGKRYTRELNTMPQWAGSCWYYLRFLDPNNQERLVDPAAERYWMVSPRKDGSPHAGGVDLYVGGVEHAVLHLLYARFWHKVLYDLGHVSTPEPFGRLFNQGYIQAFYYENDRGLRVAADEVEENDGQFTHQGQPVTRVLGKMGKALKNAVAPDDICEQYGCDTLRLYEMYLGPLDQSKFWNTRDIVGVHRFLQRLWRNFVDPDSGTLRVTEAPADDAQRRLLHQTIKRVSDDMERMSFNTAIAALIEMNNALVGEQQMPREVAEPLVLLLSPMAPHMAEELWQMLGHTRTLAYEPWPRYDPALLVQQQVEYPVQVNGKLRGRITVDADADVRHIEQAALADNAVQNALAGKPVRKVIVIPDRMVNVVV